MNTLKMSAKVKLDVKRKTLPSGIITLCILFLSANVLAQTEEWKSAESKDGKIKTKYNISKRIDETGNQVPLIQYTATTTENVSMRRCVELMKDVSKHKEFQGDDVSKKRDPECNWFTLPFEKRSELMMEHGKSGRTFAGRILQLVTASAGFDDFEWGVTLFGVHADDLKDVVYTMRFDEASAKYADFGSFYVGIVTPVEELVELV
jgi:hypothetical protein